MEESARKDPGEPGEGDVVMRTTRDVFFLVYTINVEYSCCGPVIHVVERKLGNIIFNSCCTNFYKKLTAQVIN